MREGEKAAIVIPSEYAFNIHGNPHGFHGVGKAIPPRADIRFEYCHLVRVCTAAQVIIHKHGFF